MTYSIDFRRKVLSDREKEDLTIAEVAEWFCVGVATVVRWLKRLEPQRRRNKPATKIDRIALPGMCENIQITINRNAHIGLVSARKASATLCDA